MNGMRWSRELALDVRHALRGLRAQPALAAVSILTLALGIGINVLAFSLLHASLLRSPPFPRAAELFLLQIDRTNPDGSRERFPWSYRQFEWFRDRGEGRFAPAIYNRNGVNLAADVGVIRASCEVVSPEYFRVLEVQPAIGRTFRGEEDVSPGTHPVVVLGHGIWQSQFGGGDVLGRTIRANGVTLEVVGVMPAGFRGLSGEAELWIPEMMAPAVTNADHLTTTEAYQFVFARTAPGVGPRELATAVLAEGSALHVAVPDAESADGAAQLSIVPVPLAEAGADPARRRSAALLFGAVWFVLAIACVNLGILQLGRARVQAREAAVRTALGCSRGRMIQLRLAQSGILAFAGCAAGLAVALGLLPWLRSLSPSRLPGPGNLYGAVSEFAQVRIDFAVLGFAIAISLFTVLAGSMLPALRATRGDLGELLRSGSRETASGLTLRRAGPLVWLTATEIACALVLAVGAALLMQSFARTNALDHGFEAQNLITFRIHPLDPTFSVARAPGLITPVLEQVSRMPGVESATVSMCTPFMATCGRHWLSIAGRPIAGEPPVTGVHYVAPDHFRTLRIPVLRGRAFSAADRAGAPRVAVINETAARRLWPSDDAIGQRIALGDTTQLTHPDSLFEIVGIAGDVRYWPPDQPARLDVYIPYLQFTYATTYIIARTTGSTASSAAIRKAIGDLDPDLAIDDVLTMEQRTGAAIAPRRFLAVVQTGFAILALVLAATGVYGVASMSVAMRVRELGVRIALGASPGRVFRQVLREGAQICIIGLAAGMLLSLALARTLSSMLFETSATDPRTLSGVALVVLAAALVAIARPAWLAARAQPADALRSDRP